MKPSIPSLLCGLLSLLLPLASAERMLYSDSLNPCQANNNFSATQFDVLLTPANNSLSFQMTGVSTITGNVTIDLVVIAYGLNAYQTTLNPCELGFEGFCPMQEGPVNLPQSNVPIPAGALNDVPGMFGLFDRGREEFGLTALSQALRIPSRILTRGCRSTSTRPTPSNRRLASKRSFPTARRWIRARWRGQRR